MSTTEITLRTRVVITKDEQGRWFARGLDIDYAAQGRSSLEVRKAFESGFVDTVMAHLEEYGDLRHFEKSAPDHVVEEYERIAAALAANRMKLSLEGAKKYNAVVLDYYPAKAA